MREARTHHAGEWEGDESDATREALTFVQSKLGLIELRPKDVVEVQARAEGHLETTPGNIFVQHTSKFGIHHRLDLVESGARGGQLQHHDKTHEKGGCKTQELRSKRLWQKNALANEKMFDPVDDNFAEEDNEDKILQGYRAERVNVLR